MHNLWIQVLAWGAGALFATLMWAVWTMCERVAARMRNNTHTRKEQ